MDPRIHSVERVVPANYASQAELLEAFRGLWAKDFFNFERLEELHRAVGVEGRHLALPLEDYRPLTSFKARNDAWIAAATDLGEKAVRGALAKADLTPRDVDHLFFVTVTGVATPSVDARLMNRLGLREDVKRTPIFGLGCVAGAAGTARAADFLRAYPRLCAVLLAVELCSLTLQREDVSVANIISSGLFGDGAAAVVLSGGETRAVGPQIVATRSIFYRDTERIMGWDVVDSGFKVVLSAKVPDLVRTRIGKNVDDFLLANGLGRRDITHWIAHTGGPKVLQAFEEALELPPNALARSWSSLKEVGNLSSASVLHVLGALLESGEPKAGQWGLMMAMGPGFCAELVLLRW